MFILLMNFYSYTYNRMGLPGTLSGNDITTSYTCDNAGRMIQDGLTDGTVKGYNYDTFGNRSGMTVNGAEKYTESYIYDRNNRLLKQSRNQNGKNGEEGTYVNFNGEPILPRYPKDK